MSKNIKSPDRKSRFHEFIRVSGTEVTMHRPIMLFAGFIALPASLLALQAKTIQGPQTPLENSPTAEANPGPASLVLELDRAIVVLKQGLKENWQTRDQYLVAFEKTPGTDTTGRLITDVKKHVKCAISTHLRTHRIWDEGPPLGVEVHQTIIELEKLRNETKQAKTARHESSNPVGQAGDLRLPPCAAPTRNITVSAGVASGMLKTKIDPVYPADAKVSGTVVLHATISAKGRVEALSVISGPLLLRQAALEAVRQWIYRPYRLDNVAVEFETTIEVVIASH